MKGLISSDVLLQTDFTSRTIFQQATASLENNGLKDEGTFVSVIDSQLFSRKKQEATTLCVLLGAGCNRDSPFSILGKRCIKLDRGSWDLTARNYGSQNEMIGKYMRTIKYGGRV